MTAEAPETIRRTAEHLAKFIVPILAYPTEERNPARWLTGGTCLMVSSPDARFLVTAEHVIAEIDALRGVRPIALLLCIPGRDPLDISRWEILDRDNFVDICTIEIPPEFDVSTSEKRILEIPEWPRPRAQTGDLVHVVGYPAAHRRGTDSSIRFRITPLNDYVSDVGPRKFTVADENAEREVLFNPENLLIPEHFGGMSGAPAFRLRSSERPEFIGIYSTGGDGLRGAWFLSHADFILSNGKLDQLAIPPR